MSQLFMGHSYSCDIYDPFIFVTGIFVLFNCPEILFGKICLSTTRTVLHLSESWVEKVGGSESWVEKVGG